jgi:Xaa-Pro aminopeptidase
VTSIKRDTDFAVYIQRRRRLCQLMREACGFMTGSLVLYAGVEGDERVPFRQDSAFYYFTGLTQPGLVCMLHADGQSTLFVPRYAIDRSIWVDEPMALIPGGAGVAGFDTIAWLGDACPGYALSAMMPHTHPSIYHTLCQVVGTSASHAGVVFMVEPVTLYQKALASLIEKCMPAESSVQYVTAQMARMRRRKDDAEVAYHERAIEITAHAQAAAAATIKPGIREAVVKAALEAVMIAEATRPAFPSIVASGPNSTVLHYTGSDRVLTAGDVVIIDIGAEYAFYAADITRTYPASGTFSARQRELYEVVLAVQEYVATQAKPGYWLKNGEHPETSLHHMAAQYFKKNGGYDRYFMHGIGHYLGLDVHDVGSYQEPLAVGDVFTIEPGLYIREEGIGIRIEDNYLMTEDGARCLSAAIPKTVEEIERVMATR